MAPVRRYLRISAWSVLEVRIYLDNPADAHRWLLRPSDPALPRVIAAVRPLVLPKLREERRRASSKSGGGKKKGRSVKDVVTTDDFEVSIFLTEQGTSHGLLTRAKIFKDESGGQQKPGGADHDGRGTRAEPVEVADAADEDGDETTVPNLRMEEDSDDDSAKVNLADIPLEGTQQRASDPTPVEISDSEDDQDEAPATPPPTASTRGQGRRRVRGGSRAAAAAAAAAAAPATTSAPRRTRAGRRDAPADRAQDDKKKLGFRTDYDGFRIHGKTLCLVVKRIGGGPRGKNRQAAAGASAGQAVMENWIASTQENPAMLDD